MDTSNRTAVSCRRHQRRYNRANAPTGYFGGAHNSRSNAAYINGTNFPNGGKSYSLIGKPGPPGIGRNSWNGPCYLNTDLSAAKQQSFKIMA